MRVKENVGRWQIEPFKFSLKGARKMANIIQNGEEVKPVHLQKINDKNYRCFKVCSGENIAAGYMMLGRKLIPSIFSNTIRKK
jgi:hypothetical protein